MFEVFHGHNNLGNQHVKVKITPARPKLVIFYTVYNSILLTLPNKSH